VSPAIGNNGLIEALGGRLKLSGAVTGTGKLQIDASSILELGSAATDNQGVAFAGSKGTLQLDKPSAYTGVISGFGATETIDLRNTLASNATLNGNQMVVTLSGGGTLTYTLANPPAGVVLKTSSDGHGGTLINTGTAAAVMQAPSLATVGGSAVATGDTFGAAAAALFGQFVAAGFHGSSASGIDAALSHFVHPEASGTLLAAPH
jgi:hypothetical protein